MSQRRIALLLIAGVLVAPAAQAQSKEGCIRASIPAPGRLLAQSAPGVIMLGLGPRIVRLEPVCAGRGIGLAQQVASAAPRRRFLLVIDDLRAQAQPGVLFDLTLGSGPDQGRDGWARLGTLNFFAAQRPGVAARPRRISYDVTEPLRALAVQGRLSDGAALAIQPLGVPAPGARMAIGSVALVEP